MLRKERVPAHWASFLPNKIWGHFFSFQLDTCWLSLITAVIIFKLFSIFSVCLAFVLVLILNSCMDWCMNFSRVKRLVHNEVRLAKSCKMLCYWYAYFFCFSWVWESLYWKNFLFSDYSQIILSTHRDLTRKASSLFITEASNFSF